MRRRTGKWIGYTVEEMRFVIGIDEVGRGALAGPVIVAAVWMPRGVIFRNLKDSKKLTPHLREKWFEKIKKDPRLEYAIARMYPKAIDRMNIAKATNKAAYKAYVRLRAGKTNKIRNCETILDGNLYLPKSIKQKTVVRGDEKFTAVKLASIVAKVTRDGYMVKLHKQDPRYGFDIHKGYGTKLHCEALRKNGYSMHHRKSFHIN